MTVSISLASALHKSQIATTDPWHLLLTAYPDKDDPSVILRLVREPFDVVYKGDTYIAFNFDFDPITDGSSGELTSLTLRVCNVNRLIHSYLEQYDGGVGARVELRVVSAQDLAGDPSIFMQWEITEASADSQWATLTLGADNPMRQAFPRFVYLKDYCMWRYKGTECLYSGGLATCDHTLGGANGCRVHNNSARFGGFPGIDSAGFRVASII